MQAARQLVFDSVIWFQFLGGDVLTVRFRLPQRPLATNGEWVDEELVHWKARLAPAEEPSNHSLPVQCYALWSEPDTEAQKNHFGRVLLNNEELAKYVLWYSGLTADEAREWDAFIDGLTPNDNLLSHVNEFRFSSEDESTSKTFSLRDEPRRHFNLALQQQDH